MSFTNIASGVSTDNPCMLIVRSKGYDVHVTCYRGKDNSVKCLYSAANDSVLLSGLSGAELLGLVLLWETYGKDWCKQEPNIMDEIVSEEASVDDEPSITTFNQTKAALSEENDEQ